MGIKKLMEFVRKTAPKAIESRLPRIQALLAAAPGAGAAAIDANNHLMRLAMATKTTDDAVLADALSTWLSRLCRTFRWRAVYLLCDGARTPEKKWENARRRRHAEQRREAAARQRRRLELLEASSPTDAEWVDMACNVEEVEDGYTAAQRAARHRQQHINAAREAARRALEVESIHLDRAAVERICRLAAAERSGRTSAASAVVHVWRASGEAETLASVMARCGAVAAVVSNDSDCLPLGAPLMLQVLNGRTALVVLDRLNMSVQTLAVLSVLAGCDMAPHIRGVACTTAGRLLRKFPTLNLALESLAGSRKMRPSVAFPMPASTVQTWRFVNDECPRCDKKAKLPVRTCDRCGGACCARPACWKKHILPCFAATCRAAMVRALEMFTEAHRQAAVLHASRVAGRCLEASDFGAVVEAACRGDACAARKEGEAGKQEEEE